MAMSKTYYTWKDQVVDLALMLLSISLWPVALWLAAISFEQDDPGWLWILAFGCLIASVLIWPSSYGAKDHPANKKSPWSY